MIENSANYPAELKAVGRGDGGIADLASAALALASLDRPGVSLQKYEHHLKILALDLKGMNITSQSATQRAMALADVLNARHEYTGNKEFYEDLQNANLMSVIDTRKGLPVSLSILYIHVARCQGWHIEGLNFPQHFLIRLYGASSAVDAQVIIDPFNDGNILKAKDLREMIQEFKGLEYKNPDLRPEYYEPITDRQILVRLLENIKIRCLKVSDLGQAINILMRLVLIDPEDIQHHYELGMLLAHVGRNEPARKSLSYCRDNIDKIKQNDLIEQQVINILLDLDKQDMESKRSNILKLPEIE
ncbi:MAG: transglutaminase-like domain-containing protein [Emcibacter sp.]|nr:transglutaminase-like domain-containing protein [Emcibacter sp.]